MYIYKYVYIYIFMYIVVIYLSPNPIVAAISTQESGSIDSRTRVFFVLKKSAMKAGS